MRKEEERKTKQKRRVVNAAPEQENPKSLRSNQRGTALWDGAKTQPLGCRDSAGGAGEWGGALGSPTGAGRSRQGSQGWVYAWGALHCVGLPSWTCSSSSCVSHPFCSQLAVPVLLSCALLFTQAVSS